MSHRTLAVLRVEIQRRHGGGEALGVSIGGGADGVRLPVAVQTRADFNTISIFLARGQPALDFARLRVDDDDSGA